MSPTIRDEPAQELDEVRRGRLPPRYSSTMQSVFASALAPLLEPGVSILDVGSGRAPTLAPDLRPEGTIYDGLDLSPEELEAADPGAYSEAYVRDLTRPLGFDGRYDVILSWQVLEHVSRMDAALQNIRTALRPGGTLLAQLSGSRAVFAVAARLMPHRARVLAMKRLLGHPEEEKFPVYYDNCRASALEALLSNWTSVSVTPFYRGATYLDFWRPGQLAYLAYENLLARRDTRDLATHYLVEARR